MRFKYILLLSVSLTFSAKLFSQRFEKKEASTLQHKNEAVILNGALGLTLVGAAIEGSLGYRFKNSVALKVKASSRVSGASLFGIGAVFETQELAFMGGYHFPMSDSRVRFVLEGGPAIYRVNGTVGFLFFDLQTDEEIIWGFPLEAGFYTEYKYVRTGFSLNLVSSGSIGIPLYATFNIGFFLY